MNTQVAYFQTLDRVKPLMPGALVSTTIALAANFLGINYNVPTMVFALLLGMAFNFLTENPKCAEGIEFCSKVLLRIGIALLGIRITINDIISLGVYPILIVTCGVLSTILFGVFAARIIGVSNRLGILAGGSVGICGASAALAISSVMPDDSENRKMTIFTVISVTSFSTIAMILYPIVCQLMGLNTQESSLFLGGTIHDVAQVVGAGYSVSPDVGELSTFIKLLRVAMLIPIVIFLTTFIFRSGEQAISGSEHARRIFPFFLLGFLFFVIIGSMGIVPAGVKSVLSSTSGLMLVIAISALGVKTSLKEMAAVGWKPLLLVIINTVFIAVFILSMIFLIR